MYTIKFLDGTTKQLEILEGANLVKADLRGANLVKADLRGANLEGVDLRKANLQGADLRGANLRGANLEGTNLRFALLEGANLRGALLKGANLEHTSIISMTLGKHFLFYHEGYLKIGCEGHSIDHWIAHIQEIGTENGYSESEIKRYKKFITTIQECINELT